MALQVEQQQQVVTRKQEQAMAARQVLQQVKAAPQPNQQIAHLILQQNQPLYLARVLQVQHTIKELHRQADRTLVTREAGSPPIWHAPRHDACLCYALYVVHTSNNSNLQVFQPMPGTY